MLYTAYRCDLFDLPVVAGNIVKVLSSEILKFTLLLYSSKMNRSFTEKFIFRTRRTISYRHSLAEFIYIFQALSLSLYNGGMKSDYFSACSRERRIKAWTYIIICLKYTEMYTLFPRYLSFEIHLLRRHFSYSQIEFHIQLNGIKYSYTQRRNQRERESIMDIQYRSRQRKLLRLEIAQRYIPRARRRRK